MLRFNTYYMLRCMLLYKEPMVPNSVRLAKVFVLMTKHLCLFRWCRLNETVTLGPLVLDFVPGPWNCVQVAWLDFVWFVLVQLLKKTIFVNNSWLADHVKIRTLDSVRHVSFKCDGKQEGSYNADNIRMEISLIITVFCIK